MAVDVVVLGKASAVAPTEGRSGTSHGNAERLALDGMANESKANDELSECC